MLKKNMCAALLLGTVTLLTSQAHAQDSIQQAIRKAKLDGLTALERRGAQLKSVDNIEFLPRGGASIQATFTLPGKQEVVLPLKGKHTTKDCKTTWRITWAPVPAFTNALVGVVTSGTLPQAQSFTPWTQAQRTPSMPIVMTRQQVITPFGAHKPTPSRIDPRTPPHLAEILPAPGLIEDTQRWLEKHLEGEPGAASIDLIADERTTWQDFQRVLYAVSSQGIFKVYFVIRSGGVVEAAAPIFGSIPGPKRPVPLVLGMYPQGKETGWRVSLGAKLMTQKHNECNSEMTFCSPTPQKFRAILKSVLPTSGTPIQHVMLATTRTTTLAQMVPWIWDAPRALGLSPSRVFVGYIQR